jgi:hypothetical protein
MALNVLYAGTVFTLKSQHLTVLSTLVSSKIVFLNIVVSRVALSRIVLSRIALLKWCTNDF